MKGTLLEALVTTLIRNGIIESSEEELYRFGIKQLFLSIVNVATSLVIGAICGTLWQSVLFSLAYIPLRRYAGGYHAKTPVRCYILSVSLIITVLMLLKYVTFSKLAMVAILALSALVILLKAPVESTNKPLSDAEQNAYKMKTRVILGIECLLTMALSIKLVDMAACITMSIGCSGLMLIIPMWREKSGAIC